MCYTFFNVLSLNATNYGVSGHLSPIGLLYPISVTNPLRNFPIEGSIFCGTKIMVPPPTLKQIAGSALYFRPLLLEFYDSPI